MTTTLVQEKDVTRQWYVLDAADKPVGRLAVEIANVLRGRHKPTYAPHIDTGDFVVVVNAEKVKLTGAKEENKVYKRFTGFPSGQKLTTAGALRKKNPTMILSHAVKGMLPRNRLSRKMIKRLKIYAGPEHPHVAQNPQPLEV